jgi:glycosyltransferase involved in cell wall biosynthesis
MKTICVDCRMLRSSGIGTYLRSVLGRLIAAKEYNFCLIGNKEDIIEWLSGDVKYVSIVSCDAPIYGIREQLQVWRSIPRDSDLYWTPHYVTPLLYTGKCIVTVHDVAHIAMSNNLDMIQRAYARFMFYMLANKSPQIIAVSQFTKSELMKYTKIKASNIQVIYNGHPEIANKRDRKGDKGNFILYVGNVKPHKNLRRVIEAHQKIYPLIRKPLIIVGKKSGFITGDPAVADLVKSIPGEQVSFTGLVSDQELAGYYRGAAMLVFASLYEGFGLPPLEAMSYGTPVLASKVASIPEVCGDAALYCDPYSVDDIAAKMLLLIRDRGLRQACNKKGRERIRLFSWENCASQHLSIIRKMIEN